MKRILLAFTLAAIVIFSGCSGGPKVAGAPETVKTYLLGQYADLESVETSLKAAGFEILDVYTHGKKKKALPIIVITNDYIKSLANKPMRGLLAGVLRVTVNKAKNEIRVTNPMYYLHAYLQDEYKLGMEKPIVDALMKAIPSLTDAVTSKDAEGNVVDENPDQLDFDGIASYHYMIGMPYYNDLTEIGRGESVDALYAKLQKKAKKKLLYTIKLAPNRLVCGVKLGKRTSKFPKKIGLEKAGVLPWQILIEEIEEDGKKVAIARALDAKYKIALSYPLLSMVGKGSFAGIMTVPGAVEKDLMKFFK